MGAVMVNQSVVRMSWLALLAVTMLTACAEVAAAVPETTTRPAGVDNELLAGHSHAAQANKLFEAGAQAFRQNHPDQAMHHWHEAALLGHERAQYNLGSGYASGTSLPRDFERAAYWWRQAALQGNTDALYNLGVLNYEGRGMERSVAKAKHWWRRAARQGDPASMFRLGWLAATGDGEISDMAEARLWWEQSAHLGFAPAIKALEILNRDEGRSPASARR
ncbi:MAG: hypothetical protein A2140_02115 [Candidatus Muproteobacteria bacterium RBG_16_62_13]|uniref:Sel1 repeat family protein n=1 Tax=Candidatus Muproteobacteria bacterium RBG_16_62_13 TaxID=1817756 RepID=A0A1F6T8E0_9PROT|nr:MAG: hypothetical protein A2140_02115 [Candidatus Muproteobacteria bacterium RBG_16_62_13]